MNLNVKGIMSKITKNADTIGGLTGFLTGSTHGFEDVKSSFENLLRGQVHMPDIVNAIQSYLDQPYFKNALYLYLVGFVAKEFNLPVIGKYGKTIEKIATSYGAGALANILLWSSTHSGEGSAPKDGLFNFGGSKPSERLEKNPYLSFGG